MQCKKVQELGCVSCFSMHSFDILKNSCQLIVHNSTVQLGVFSSIVAVLRKEIKVNLHLSSAALLSITIKITIKSGKTAFKNLNSKQFDS